MRRLFAFVLLAPALAAQDLPPGYARLDAEARQRNAVDEVYVDQLEAAWDRALADGLYARADSLAVLARVASEAETGVPYDSLAFPSPADALALRFLRGDLAALDWIADGGRWWQDFLVWNGETLDAFEMGTEPWKVQAREATRAALARDSSFVLATFIQEGAGAEGVAAARLAMARLGADVEWGDHAMVVVGQEELNDRSDAFLETHPRTRYGRFVRQEIRRRYERAGALAIYIDLGGAGATSTLGSGTSPNIGGAVGLGVRAGAWHADLSVRFVDLPFRETVLVGEQEVVDGEHLSVALVGVSAGPRLSLGGLDVLPYGMLGVMGQDINATGEDEPTFSTYEPPVRPGWGYGLALEYRFPTRSGTISSNGFRLSVNRLHPRLNQGFQDVFSGAATTIAVGYVSALQGYRRVE